MYFPKWKLKSMFNEWYCDYLTIKNYANVYNVSYDTMTRMLNIGRKLHNIEAEKLKVGIL